MALIHFDGFDHWGSIANMQIGTWVYLSNDGLNNATVSTVNPRTGAYCLKLPSNTGINYNEFKRVWDGVSSTAGVGFAHYIAQTYSAAVFGVTFGDLLGNGLISFLINTNNGFDVWRSSGANRFGTLLGSSPVNVLRPGSYNYIECKCYIHSATGRVEIRVNEISVLIIIGNTGGTGTMISSLFVGKINHTVTTGIDAQIDDFVMWDDTGTINNDFLGDRRCVTSFPSADTAIADWVSTGGAPYGTINETPPNTANYVTANLPGAISEFEKDHITVVATAVAGVKLFALARKEDVGSSTFRVGVNSGGVVQNSPTFAPGTGWAFYSHIIERNPNGDIPWTKTTIDAANIRLTRED